MLTQYTKYYWKEGRPYGLLTPGLYGKSYRIVHDPYWRRCSIEEYEKEQFRRVIYDSLLLDFSRLKEEYQEGWNRERCLQKGGEELFLIRDQNERVILFESSLFEAGKCRETRLFSSQHTPLATQRICYTSLGDSFNGVVFYDLEKEVVMYKVYAYDEQREEFTKLLHEEWDPSHKPPPSVLRH